MAEYTIEISLDNLNKNKKTISQATETDSKESVSKIPVEKGNSGQDDCSRSKNCLELNTMYKITYEKTPDGRNTYSSNWSKGESGQSGCDGSYTSLNESTLKGHGATDIKIKPQPYNLTLDYVANYEPKSHVLHSTSKENISYTINDPFSYTFSDTDLIINFTEIYYKYSCGGRLCDKGGSTANGYACCYFTLKSDS